MITEVHYFIDGKLCGCPVPGKVTTGLRLQDNDPERPMLWIRCNSCGAEVSALSRNLKSTLILEEK